MQEYKTYDAHGKHAQRVVFTKDGSKLVSVGLDSFVRLWRVPEFEEITAFKGHQNSVNTLSFNPDETRLATTSSDGTMRIWAFPEGDEVTGVDKISNARYSPDGKHIATTTTQGKIELRDADSFEVLLQFQKVDKRIFAIAISPKGKQLLAGGTGPLYVFDVTTGEEVRRFTDHELAVPCIEFSPDGKLLLSTGAEGSLCIRGARDLELYNQVQLDMKGVLQLAVSPVSDFVAVSGDHRIQLVSVPDGNRMERLKLSIKGVYGLAISPDGRFLANAGADGKIRIWKVPE